MRIMRSYHGRFDTPNEPETGVNLRQHVIHTDTGKVPSVPDLTAIGRHDALSEILDVVRALGIDAFGADLRTRAARDDAVAIFEPTPWLGAIPFLAGLHLEAISGDPAPTSAARPARG